MSLEWPWLGVLGAIVVPALGHLYHFILAVNVTSGWGFRETSAGPDPPGAAGDSGGLRRPSCSGRHLADPWWTWAWPLRAYACLCVVSGGLIWPLTSLGLGMRRRPGGVTGRSELLDLAEQLGSRNH